MPAWLSLALSLAAVFFFLLLLAICLRVRYRVAWVNGAKPSASLEFGLPGWMWGFHFPAEPAKPVPDSRDPLKGQAGFLWLPSLWPRDRNHWRRALFRLATDGLFLQALAVYLYRSFFSVLNLLNLAVEIELSLREPQALGQVAAAWQSMGHFPATRALRLRCDFEHPAFRLRVKAKGGFSLARLLWFCARSLGNFPWRVAARRAWFCWSNSELTGWRALAYGKIQSR